MNNLRLALEAVYLRELEQMPSEPELETQVVVSREFEDRMEKLFFGQSHRAGPHRIRRILLAAVLAALLASAMSVQAIRGPVIRFFLDIQEEFSRLVFSTEELQPTEEPGLFIPDAPSGFEETARDVDGRSAEVEYWSEDGHFLSYSQERIEGLGMYLDTEDAQTDWESISGVDIFVVTNKGFVSMVWSDGVYVYDIATNAEVSVLRDFAEKIIKKIK